jgi:putative FmdB family regulatory protein
MPIYEYRCTKCHATFELLQKAKDQPAEQCQKCGGRLVKLVSSPAIQFKGNGWYITDYAKKSSPGPGEKPAPEAKPGKSGKEGAKPSPPSAD